MNPLHAERLLRSGGRTASWPQRVLFVVIGTVVIVAGFFFVAVVIAVGAFIALGLAIRWWWVLRRIRAHAKATAPLEGEYAVIEKPAIESRPLER